MIRTWVLLALSALAQGQSTTDPHPAEIPVGIRFHGFLPGSTSRELEGEFPVEFRIYRTPQGGEAIWSHQRSVAVHEGMIDVVLGDERAIPQAIHEATFKFLGASVSGGPEVYPRYPIVNVVFVSAEEASAAAAKDAYEEDEPAPDPIGAATEPAATWTQALKKARAAGQDLPDYEEWYRSLRLCPEAEARERCGHYEWVLPWVYDTASHGLYNRYFRGRFQGCDYMDLSPTREYVYRLARRPPRALPGAGTPVEPAKPSR